MLLLLDNRDSFTFNLAQYFAQLGAAVQVVPSDAITVAEIAALRPARLVIAPGPGAPAGAGISLEAIAAFSGRLPLLGVCLGHQAIAEAFGGAVVRGAEPVHGKPAVIEHEGTGLFEGLAARTVVGRYHSLVVEERTLPGCLRITARATDDRSVQAIAHVAHPTCGVQFHPESVLTAEGMALLRNFLALR
ncbi:anthranilate synthase component II [Vulgatibacter sp.]|uniref:anthranilate synthase component II n=1 Tax=Vulgatibacter sp. TaxID=1971226 RepID=UPI00356AE4CB